MWEMTIVIDPNSRFDPAARSRGTEGLERDLERRVSGRLWYGCRKAATYGPADGHNRHEISMRRNLPYATKVFDLPSRKTPKDGY